MYLVLSRVPTVESNLPRSCVKRRPVPPNFTPTERERPIGLVRVTRAVCVIRTLLGLGGIVVALIPGRVIELYENLAIENPDECPPKSWVAPAIRAEGIGLAILSLSGGRAYATFMKFAGAVGVVAFFFPRQYAAFGFGIAWKRSDSIEWRSGLFPAVRVMGAFSALLAYCALKEQRSRRIQLDQ